MMTVIKELIEQIGGRERLQEIETDGFLMYGESKKLARALLAVLDAHTSPVWGQARFKGGEWSSCSAEHAAMVMENPAEWVNYECRYLYTTPPAASVPEWSNEQCMEFLTVAFRHCDISGDIEMDDIRLGVKMANAAAPAPGVEK